METHVLEVNLISAQELKEPSIKSRRLQTYAVVWVDPSMKLHSRIDKIGGENPSWNDKFFFKVSPDFLCSETSAVSVEIYAVGILRDNLIGTVRFLISNFLPSPAATSAVIPSMKAPAFTALQIRRPSGRFHGVLNICAMVINGSDFAALSGVSAIGYRDFMQESLRGRRRRASFKKSKSTVDEYLSRASSENSFGDSGDQSDGGESTTSSSSTASTALKEWNGRIRYFPPKTNHLRSSSDGAGILCGLLPNRRASLCPSDLARAHDGSHGKRNW
ncbi:hypothetical protein SLE2022_029140 [Rubroshorea leprosula]